MAEEAGVDEEEEEEGEVVGSWPALETGRSVASPPVADGGDDEASVAIR